MQKIFFILVTMFTLALLMSCSETKTEEEYFTLANEQYGQEAYADAIENFKIILEKYPQGKTTAKSTFMLGFINANSLENLEEAKKYYTLFVEKYPEHDLADDAQYELNTLGQDINDLPIFKDMKTDEQASTEN
jgi:outer membrane protein assembly factor BamD (BamD/ComL family)